MIDYSLFYRQRFDSPSDPGLAHNWDTFVSAFNRDERVTRVFEEVTAREKIWVLHREYDFADADLPTNAPAYSSSAVQEGDFVREFLDRHLPDPANTRLCVDITGFMRPHLMVLIRFLAERGVRRFEALYSEPVQYIDGATTEFALGDVDTVRQVDGFQGLHELDPSGNELLVIGAGYESHLIAYVAQSKATIRHKVQLLGFPPLQADFYQENILQVARSAEAVGGTGEDNPFFAPANDPFVTAEVLRRIVEKFRRTRGKELGVRNVYLSPLSTRPQALGFALYYVHECINKPVSIIYPFSMRYNRETSTGLAHTWHYTVELPARA